MSIIKAIASGFKRQSRKKKIMLICTVMVSIALLISVTSLAWFSYQRRAAKLQKIESPNSLFLNAAHREDSVNFQVTGIDPEEIEVDKNNNKVIVDGKEVKITHKDYVFNVTGDSVDKFIIQLAYTTNNPFTYEVYAAQEYTEKPDSDLQPGEPIDYVTYELNDDPASGLPDLGSSSQYHPDATGTLYYKIDSSVTDDGVAVAGKYTGTYLNRGNDGNATDSYHELTYGDYNRQNVHDDAQPIYWQATGVSAFPSGTNDNKEPFSRHFILRVSWPEGSLDRTAKETDILYITVKATS